jgi:lipoate-protein ligase A
MQRAMGETWRLLPWGNGPAGTDLALAEALLKELPVGSTPAVRWYGVSTPALVIGSGQKLAEIDLEACAALGITVHRRASGGGAVLFTPGFLMQDIALPQAHRLRIDDVTESYRWLGELWAGTLARLGITAQTLAIAAARSDTQTIDPLIKRACFGGRSPYEILAGGRKLVGFSQIRRRAGLLYQVGIYRHWPGRQLAGLLRLDPSERSDLVARLAGRVVGLDELVASPPSEEVTIQAFAAELQQRYGATLVHEDYTADERTAAAAVAPRYAAL